MERKLNKAEIFGIAYAQARAQEAQRELNQILDMLGLPIGTPFTVADDGTVSLVEVEPAEMPGLGGNGTV